MRHLLIFTLFICLIPSVAFAQSEVPEQIVDGECQSDSDCDANEVCVFETADCACAAPGEGEDPEPCDCSSETYSYCQPGPPPECGADGSCPGDLVCVTYQFDTCEGGGALPPCEPGENCTDPEPDPEPTCTTESESYCVPQYIAPCQADADCGPGFTCEASEICQCSAGTGTSDGTDPDGNERPLPDEEPDCSCEPTGEQYCQLIEQPCTTDNDCAGTLTCESFGAETAPCRVVPGDDGEDTCDDSGTDEEVAYCVPQDYEYWGFGGGNGVIAEASGHDEDSLAKAERNTFFPGGDGGDGSTKTRAGGCASADASPSLGLLLLLGLFGFVSRRRRK